ncbi:hypothetical protein EDF56_10919 [Novosphingobium sp. PhB165]|uniref:hypothetical protein n=1 Tax=Novosphingobium sp. PhB165 TaxID=2485105 RepID=UPI0010438A54|nr:hypothetical protein [Novosphingobium sp. PhB165]TCM15691.1 hypothetical protein EDF56_10919 [Novosphingobium sp. PhB165]
MNTRAGKVRKGIGKGNLAARLLAAVPANYALSSLAAACVARALAHGLAVSAPEASMAATLLSFAIFAVLALAAFGMRSVVRLWLWMLVSGAVMGGYLWFSLTTGGRL